MSNEGRAQSRNRRGFQAAIIRGNAEEIPSRRTNPLLVGPKKRAHARLQSPSAQRSSRRCLISNVLPFGRLWYGEPNATSNAVDYTKFFRPRA